MTKQKVFGIGLSRTGTTSFTAALRRMGYVIRGYPHILHVIDEAEEKDGVTDSPVIPYMEILDRLYPDARFVLTHRDKDSWVESCRRRWGLRPLDTVAEWELWNRRTVYGIEHFDERKFRQVYDNHVSHVKSYFEGRSYKLLILNICAGEGYAKLCPFLDEPIINEPFPHKNKSKE